jgi:thymidine kinase
MNIIQDSGRIEVITGCMFAGKTEELLRRLRRAEIANADIEIVKPEIDDRYGEETVGTHVGRTWEARIISLDEEGRDELNSIDSDIIAVDEFNFFDSSFVSVLNDLANDGKRVMVSGLDQTYRGEPFSPMDEAIAIADGVDKLSAVCEKCGSEATKTQRIIDGEPAKADEPTVVVGAEESYQARCRKCHTVR